MEFSESSAFVSLPARPPTPPRDTLTTEENADADLEAALDFLSSGYSPRKRSQPVRVRDSFTDTPTRHSPASSASQAFSSPSKRVQKRVNFSPWTTFHKSPNYAQRVPSDSQSSRPQPSHRDRRQPKSILKPSDPSTINSTESPGMRSPSLVSSRKFDSFASMLESVMNHLARDDRDSRLDAYISLLGTLKAYEKVPDVTSLEEKAGLLSQFMQRDISATIGSSRSPDTPLVTQALKLLTVLLRLPSFAARLDDDFCSSFVDRSITILQEDAPSKAIATHYLFVLGVQNFKKKIITPDKAGKLLDLLANVEERVKGNGVIGHRIVIYRKLLEQSLNLMISRVVDWLPHVFHAMLSSITEIRTRSIEFGIFAAVTVGHSPEAYKAVKELLEKDSETGVSYGQYLLGRLEKMLESKEEGCNVPPIWSVVILLLRSRKHRLTEWSPLKSWLHLIQRCFNAGNWQTRYQVNATWNRFIWMVAPDASTNGPMVSLLRKPILAQLKRKGNEDTDKRVRRIAQESYCNLLYYAFRPDATVKQINLYWDAYVKEAFTELVPEVPQNMVFVCRVLIALFGGGNSTLWDEDKAVSAEPVKPEDLPRIDPAWIRAKMSAALDMVRLCLDYGGWSSEDDSQSPAKILWQRLMRAVAEAANKEIKISADFKESIAHLMNFLHKLGKSIVKNGCVAQCDLEMFGFLIQTAIVELGANNFSERILVRNEEADFEVMPTPSHRTRNGSVLQTPLQHILKLMLTLPCADGSHESMMAIATEIVDICCSGRTTRFGQLEILRDCTEVTVSIAAIAENAQVASDAWDRIASAAKNILEDGRSASRSPAHSTQLNSEYQLILQILAAGLRFRVNTTSEAAVSLHASAMTTIRHEAGDGVAIVTLTEALADFVVAGIKTAEPQRLYQFTTLLLAQGPFYVNKKNMSLAKRALGLPAVEGSKTADFDPYTLLYSAIVESLSVAYARFIPDHVNVLTHLIEEVHLFVQRCPLPRLALLLRKIQKGLAVWIEDPEQKLSGPSNGCPRLSGVVLELWSTVSSDMSRLQRHDSLLLKALEPLLVSALSSRRKGIVNITVLLWNKSFGQQASLDYPPAVEHILQRLKPVVDLQLPDGTTGNEDQVAEIPPSFWYSQDDKACEDDLVASPSNPPSMRYAKPQLDMAGKVSKPTASPQVDLPTAGSSIQNTPKSRRRHDNSQIQFAVVESSPISERDSQLLTEHQKEVRDRQKASTAVMFADIRSSPMTRAKDCKSNLPELILSSDLAVMSSFIEDGPQTPEHTAPTRGSMDRYVTSSPTPKSAPRRTSTPRNNESIGTEEASMAHNDNEFPELPSSPPSVHHLDPSDEPIPSIERDTVEESAVAASFDHLNASGNTPHLPSDQELATHKDGAETDDLPTEQQAVAMDASSSPVRYDSPRTPEPRSSPSDSSLPTRQLAAEFQDYVERAQNELSQSHETLSTGKTAVGDSFDSLDEQAATQEPAVAEDLEIGDAESTPRGIASAQTEQPAHPEVNNTPDEAITRVTNSFISTLESDRTTPTQASSDAEANSSGNRKRKQSLQGNNGSIKKAKNASPFKQLLSKMFGNAEPPSAAQTDTNEEEVLDCIVVAARPAPPALTSPKLKAEPLETPTKSTPSLLLLPSSSRQSSQVSDASDLSSGKQGPNTRGRKRKSIGQTVDLENDAGAEDRKMEQVEVPIGKRRRGRSRKEDSSPATETPERVLRSSKRLSLVDIPAKDSATKGTRRGKHPLSQGSVKAAAASPVVIRATFPDAESQKDKPSDRNNDAAEGDKPDVDPEQAEGRVEESEAHERTPPSSVPGTPTSIRNRVILTPRSLLGRLKGILVDCQRMVLGSQEERELDNVLFEVRREIHEAARRGRTT